MESYDRSQHSILRTMNKVNNELDWQAFRYVANEMSEAESSDFESLLLTDQTAREAVARAIEETAHIRQALAHSDIAIADLQRSSWNRKSRRTAVVAIGSCLTLLVAIFVVRISLPVSDGGLHYVAEDDSAGLAFAWVEARGELLDLEQEVNTELTDIYEAVLDSTIVLEEDETLVAPTWMLAALAKLDDGADFNELIQE
jgi:hypothetical protein